VRELEIEQPNNSEKCSETADGVDAVTKVDPIVALVPFRAIMHGKRNGVALLTDPKTRCSPSTGMNLVRRQESRIEKHTSSYSSCTASLDRGETQCG
jgi:hypothetical protein